MNTWDKKNIIIDRSRLYGTGALNGTLANSAVINNGDGTVGIVITAHGLIDGTHIIITGTTNYDGIHEITVADANTVNITAAYVAETPAGTETYAIYFDMYNVLHMLPGGWRILQTRLTLDAAGADEALSQTLDHNSGDTWNVPLGSVNANGALGGIIDRTQYSDYLGSYDGLVMNYANTGGVTWGLEFLYEILL